MKKKAMALVLALGLVIGVVAGSSLAWLTHTSGEIENVFTDSDINIALSETTNNYKMVPGATIAKDPKVTVLKDSEACWLFVKVTENLGAWDETNTNDKFTDYLAYNIAEGWTAVDATNHPGVYYRQVDAVFEDAGKSFYVLKGTGDADLKNGYLTVNGANVTKGMMDEIDGVDSTGKTGTDETRAEIAARPTLTFKAYAIQSANLTDSTGAALGADDIAKIWNMVKPTNP